MGELMKISNELSAAIFYAAGVAVAILAGTTTAGDGCKLFGVLLSCVLMATAHYELKLPEPTPERDNY